MSSHLPVTGRVRLLLHRSRGVGNTTAMIYAAARANVPVTVLCHTEAYAQDLRHAFKVAGAGDRVQVLSAQRELERHLRGTDPTRPILIDLPVLELVASEATQAAVAADRAESLLEIARLALEATEAKLATMTRRHEQACLRLDRIEVLVRQAGSGKVRGLDRKLARLLSSP